MRMSLNLSNDQQLEIAQGRPLIADVSKSQLTCVIVRADLIERCRDMFDVTDDETLRDIGSTLANFEPEDWKSPEERRQAELTAPESFIGRTFSPLLLCLIAIIVVWAVVATAFVLTSTKSSAALEAKHANSMKYALFTMMNAGQKSFVGMPASGFNQWIHLAKKSDGTVSGSSRYDWSAHYRFGNDDWPVACWIEVNQEGRVTDCFAIRLEY